MANNISTSVTNKSEVVINQTFMLDIILTSDDKISNDASVNITRTINVDLQDSVPNIILYDNGKKGVITVQLYIYDDILDNDIVSFYIEPDSNAVGFTDTKIEYHARTLDKYSMKLTVGADFLRVPTHSNIPPSGRNFSAISAKIMGEDKKSGLSGTPVNIYDVDDVFDRVNFYASDKLTKLEVRDMGTYNGMTINTDSNGNLRFYVFATQNNSAVFNLYSEIVGVTGIDSSDKTLYIIDNNPVDEMHTLKAPIIIEENNGTLHSTTDSPTFSVNIPMYTDAVSGDTIFFFVNKLMIDDPIHIVDPSTQLNNITLPYKTAFLEGSNDYSLSYIVIKESADKYVSMPKDVTYIKYTPLDNDYEKCKVYSSFGVNENDLISESEIVNCQIISNYKNNTNQEGLFVTITGTSDSNDMTKVPLGSEVSLWLHIRSIQKRFDRLVKTVKMPDTAANGGTTNSVTIGVLQTYLAGNDSFTEQNHGKIHFYYKVSKDGVAIGNSKTWEGQIDTVPPWESLNCE
ncbi:hypothetical protein [Xenorhabdus littoralis]|uniref:hypothetical protein n=1 Tax=Xenorhabdus littoralis TaxID=2582835 RepID=UPI0029E7CC5B|nr:hypothetical protein [Xenorhabdus sp. psl]MDX7992125.1 hypothetical protein [Xenorhabdus sp. psl]